MSRGKVVLGALAGVAIGAITGILLAPEKGSTTRKQIKDKSDDYMDELNSKFNDFLDSLTKKLKSTKNEVEDLVEIGKVKYDDAKQDVKNLAANNKHNGRNRY